MSDAAPHETACKKQSFWRASLFAEKKKITDPLLQRQFFFITTFSLLGFFSATIFGLLHISAQNYGVGTLELVGGVVFFLTFLLIRVNNNISLAKSVLLVTVTVLLFVQLLSGGLGRTGIYWYFTFPVIAFFLMGRINGLIWILCLCILTLITVVLSTTGLVVISYSLLEVRQLLLCLFVLSSLVYLYQYAIDSTDSKLRKGEQELQEYLDNMTTFTAKISPDGKIMNANAIAKQASGLGEQLINASFLEGSWWNFNPEVKERVQAAFQKVKVGEQINYDEQLQVATPKGPQTLTINFSMRPIFDANQLAYIVAEGRDITELKTIDQTKSEFVALASHQLRTPISAIAWFTEMLLHGDSGPINAEQAGQLTQIYQSNQRMATLVDSLLNVSRVEMGNFSIKPEPTDLAVLSHDVLRQVLSKQKTIKHLSVEEQYDKQLDPVSVDPTIMKIIFHNLIDNAYKYTPDNGEMSISIFPTRQDAKNDANNKEEGVLITIRDTGYGIPKDQQGKIFTKLFRADNGKEKETDGTGLGLYIVKSVLEQAGGRIWFDSVENKGSTFFVFLPKIGMQAKKGEKMLTVKESE